MDPGSSDKQSESAPLSPVSNEGVVAVGETQEGPIKPKRSAPPPPPSGKLVKKMCTKNKYIELEKEELVRSYWMSVHEVSQMMLSGLLH